MMSALERIWRPVRVRRMQRVVERVVALALVGGAIVSCSGGDSTTDPLQPTGRTANVVISAAPSSIVVGGTVALNAVAQDASGKTVSGATIYWSSSDDAVATVSSAGVVTAKAPGSVQIAASAEGHSALVTLAVTNVPVASVTIAPTSVSVGLGGTATLTAITYDQNGNALAGRAITWASSAPQVATVGPDGVVTSVAQGSATITATSEGKTASAAVTVTPPPTIPVATVAVAPSSGSLTVGGTMTLTAITYDASGNALTGRGIVWASSAPGVATVSTTGVVTAKSAGSATITATSEGKTGSATITVSAPAPVPVSSVTVTPRTDTLPIGGSVTLTAITYDASGSLLSGRDVAWVSSAPGVATVSGSGVVTGQSAGTATISATSEGKTGTATITVSAPGPVPVGSVSVTPTSSTLVTGATATLTAITYDANGNPLTGRTVAWSSTAPGIATVSGSGVVTAVAPGTATITATSGGKTGSATITVTAPAPVPVASVVVSPATATIDVGATTTFSATTLDASGHTLTGRVVDWSSSNQSVATVSGSGVVTAVSVGTATITASSEGQNGTASVTVQAPPATVGALDTLIVSPSPTLEILRTGQSMTFTVVAKDAQGNVLPTPPDLVAVSLQPSVVKVSWLTGSSTGTVTAAQKKTAATVRVSSGSVHTDISILVQ